MRRQEKLDMLLELINSDDGSVTKDFVTRQELRKFLSELEEETNE